MMVLFAAVHESEIGTNASQRCLLCCRRLDDERTYRAQRNSVAADP
jgi:hypothetical protein